MGQSPCFNHGVKQGETRRKQDETSTGRPFFFGLGTESSAGYIPGTKLGLSGPSG